ncbi:MAG TPA: sigma 54-interacting transcriptional regulator [Polyangiales bacterium]|nr:sigma 54-interacting transcriptional regulator [Polyangiales bacterium]
MQPRLVALFTLAFVLYVVASLGAAGVALDASVIAVAVVAAASALTPQWLSRATAAVDTVAGTPGARSVTWLGTVLALGLAAYLARSAHTMSGEMLCALALPAAAVLVLQLALRVPDLPPRLPRRLPWVLAAVAIAALGGLLGFCAALPPIWLGSRALIAPAGWANAPLWAASVCAGFGLLVRLARRRLGSDARALAANLWAAVGTVCSALALIVHPLGARHWAIAFGAGALLLGHAWTLSPDRVRVASAWTRELIASSLAIAAAAGLLAGLERAGLSLPPLALTIPFTILFVLARHGLRLLAARAFAPHGGGLLQAIREARSAAYGADDYAEFAARLLRPLRRAGRLPETTPRLISFDPPRVSTLDAAGLARTAEQALPHALAARLQQQPGEILVRSELAMLLPRRPDLAPLVRALDELDALCVVPMVASGELEGALLVARGARRDVLTLEELDALDRLAAQLAPVARGYMSLERTRLRADVLRGERDALSLRSEELSNELFELRQQGAAVRAGLGAPVPERDPVQYSGSMRALADHLTRVAPQHMPVLLCAETGIALAPIAQSIHRASGRLQEPFVILDGAELNATAVLERLCGVGSAAEAKPGLLELIGRGSLLLLDVCALSSEVQLLLAEVFEERCIRPLRSNASIPFHGRVIATARRPLPELIEAGALVPELARWFTNTSYRVPPLRERPEDLESLLLLALDRASRVLGKPAVGVEAEALKVLIEYDWPGNETELVNVVERAATRVQGERIAYRDLPRLAYGSAESGGGSFAEQERDILRRALQRASGDRTQAARALGLKRQMFIEKLTKLGIDDPASADN